MVGVLKGTRSSDSWRKVFVRKVREIGVTVNWSSSMWVVREGCEPPLGESSRRGSVVREKNRFLLFSHSWNEDYLSV